ncbi:MAG: IS200/IS605 family transposase [Planctomycetaceae bacterium]|nr:IS200/IS605 family transposase [Planctomycetaceae bacterium]
MSNAFTHLLVHAVFSTKNRRPFITKELQPRLWAYMGGVVKKEFGSALMIGGTEDHVHGLLSLDPIHGPAKVMERVKSLSSLWVNRTFPSAQKFYWQVGYGAFSVSKSQARAVARYIAKQEQHHHKQTFEEEFLELLKKHEIEYDPKYIWG